MVQMALTEPTINAALVAVVAHLAQLVEQLIQGAMEAHRAAAAVVVARSTTATILALVVQEGAEGMNYTAARPQIKSGDLLAWSHRVPFWHSYRDFKIALIRLFTRSSSPTWARPCGWPAG
jgi:hypothetical protein